MIWHVTSTWSTTSSLVPKQPPSQRSRQLVNLSVTLIIILFQIGSCAVLLASCLPALSSFVLSHQGIVNDLLVDVCKSLDGVSQQTGTAASASEAVPPPKSAKSTFDATDRAPRKLTATELDSFGYGSVFPDKEVSRSLTLFMSPSVALLITMVIYISFHHSSIFCVCLVVLHIYSDLLPLLPSSLSSTRFVPGTRAATVRCAPAARLTGRSRRLVSSMYAPRPTGIAASQRGTTQTCSSWRSTGRSRTHAGDSSSDC